jgi:hypothetical protein
LRFFEIITPKVHASFAVWSTSKPGSSTLGRTCCGRRKSGNVPTNCRRPWTRILGQRLSSCTTFTTRRITYCRLEYKKQPTSRTSYKNISFRFVCLSICLESLLIYTQIHAWVKRDDYACEMEVLNNISKLLDQISCDFAFKVQIQLLR